MKVLLKDNSLNQDTTTFKSNVLTTKEKPVKLSLSSTFNQRLLWPVIFYFISATKIVKVESKSNSSNTHSTFDAIEAEQVSADNELFKALENVDTRKKIVAELRNKVAAATLRNINAQSSFNIADAAWKTASADLEFAKNQLVSAQSALNAAQQNLQLSLTEQTQAAATLAAARKAVENAQTRFNAASKALSDAEDNLVKAKAQYSKADLALIDAKTQRAAAE